MEPQALDFYHKLKEGSMDLYFIFERRLVSTILASMKQEQGE